jgi:hypothetical protein
MLYLENTRTTNIRGLHANAKSSEYKYSVQPLSPAVLAKAKHAAYLDAEGKATPRDFFGSPGFVCVSGDEGGSGRHVLGHICLGHGATYRELRH